MLTSIQITKNSKELLHSMKKKGESYEDVIKRLIELSKSKKQNIESNNMKPKTKSNSKELKPVRLIG